MPLHRSVQAVALSSKSLHKFIKSQNIYFTNSKTLNRLTQCMIIWSKDVQLATVNYISAYSILSCSNVKVGGESAPPAPPAPPVAPPLSDP